MTGSENSGAIEPRHLAGFPGDREIQLAAGVGADAACLVNSRFNDRMSSLVIQRLP